MTQNMKYPSSACPSNYLDAMYRINQVGIPALRKYCEGKRYPVRTFDRDLAIIRQLLSGESPSRLSDIYGINRNSICVIPKRYAKYAQACKKEIERSNNKQ